MKSPAHHPPSRLVTALLVLPAAVRAQRHDADGPVLPPWPDVHPASDGVYLRHARLPVLAADGASDGAAASGAGEGGGDGGDGRRYVEQLIVYDFRPAVPPYTGEALGEALLLPKKPIVVDAADGAGEGQDQLVGGDGQMAANETNVDGNTGDRSEMAPATPAAATDGEDATTQPQEEESNAEEEKSVTKDQLEESVEDLSEGKEGEERQPTEEEEGSEGAATESLPSEPRGEPPDAEARAGDAPSGEGGVASEAGREIEGAESPAENEHAAVEDDAEDPSSSMPEGDDASATPPSNSGSGEDREQDEETKPGEPAEVREGTEDAPTEKEGENEDANEEAVLEGDVPMTIDAVDGESGDDSPPAQPEPEETATEFDAERTEEAGAVDATEPPSGDADASAPTADEDSPEETIAVQYDDEGTTSSTSTAEPPTAAVANNNNRDANRQFVDGLDELDKLFESVEVPDELDVGADGSSMQDVLVGQGLKIIWKRAQTLGRSVRGRFEGVAGSVQRALPLGILDGNGEDETEEEEVSLDALLSGLQEGRARPPQEPTPPQPEPKGGEEKGKDFPLIKSKEVQRIWKFARRKWQQARHILDDLLGIFDDDDDEDEFSLDDVKFDNVQLGSGAGLKGGTPNFGSDVDDSFLKSRYDAMLKQGQQK